MFSMMSSSVIPKKFYGARKFRSYQEVVLIYRPLGYGPSTLPLRHLALMLLSPDDFCTLNLRIVTLFFLLFKTDGLNYLRKDFVFWSDFCKKQKVLLGGYKREFRKG